MTAGPVSSGFGAFPASLELGQLPPAAQQFDRALVDRIAAITAEVFESSVTVEVEHDPDNPDSPWLLFSVDSRADIPTILQLERVWHERTAEIAPGDPLSYRLVVNPLA
jgi:hypothetical protein